MERYKFPVTVACDPMTVCAPMRDAMQVGTALDKLIAKHGADWLAELQRLHALGMTDALMRGDLDTMF